MTGPGAERAAPASAGIECLSASPDFGEAAHAVLSAQDFRDAETEIRQWEGYRPTPLYSLAALAAELGVGAVYYKHEGPRFGLGSFKALGAAYAAERVLCREIGLTVDREVTLADIRLGSYAAEAARYTLVSATDGNHGRSLAWGCRRFGARCRIYIHAEVSQGREQAMRDLGAEIVRISGDYDASVALCREEAAAHGWIVVSDTSWPGYTEVPRLVMAGYGVMLGEIVDALDAPPSHVFVQGGVGGLAAATAAAFRQRWGPEAPRLVVVEPNRAACLFESARRGRAVSVRIEDETLMAGLSCGEPSPLAWEILQSEASDFVTIDDALVAPAMRRLARPTGGDPAIEAGESGVAGLAVLLGAAGSGDLKHRLGLTSEARVLLIGSEGVTDAAIFTDITGAPPTGITADGRGRDPLP